MRHRALAAALLVIVVLVGTAPPAGAHGGPGGEDADASNYRTRVLDIEPRVEGLRLRAIDAGSRLELRNDTGSEVVVLGYDGEPYLRITDDGVFENRRSPATYLNADRYADTPVPPEADSSAPPDWRRISGGSTARWHDHRTHWMSPDPPPAVAADRGSEHVIFDAWEVPIRVGSTGVVATGDLAWIPGPSPVAAYATALVAGVAAFAVGRTRRWRAGITAAITIGLAAAVLDTIGAWQATSDGALAKVGGLTAPVLGATVAVAGVSMLRRAPREGLLMAVAGVVGIGLLVGFTNRNWLSRSQLPTGFDPTLARTVVAGAMAAAMAGLGLGVARLPSELAAAPTSARSAPRAVPVPVGLRRHRVVLIAGGIALLAVGVWATAPSDSSDDDRTAVADDATHRDLCAALDAATAGDVETARTIFRDDVHGPLHDIAAAAQRVDRSAAAQLLEAKQQTEADLVTAPERVAADLAALAPTVRTALLATGRPSPAACPQEDP